MRKLLDKIEPRFERRGKILIQELDEYLEVIFFIEGTYKVGYTLNGNQKYVMPYNSCSFGNDIGAYGVTF